MMSRNSALVRLILMAKLSSIKNTITWPRAFRVRRFSRSNSSSMLSLLRNRIESPKNPVTLQNSSAPDRFCHLLRPDDHARHRTDTYQAYLFLLDVLH